MSIFFAMMYPDTVAGAPTIISIATISLGPKPIPMATGRNMTGDFDFILKIVTDSAAGLDEVYRFVKGYEGVSATETHFVLKTLKDEVSVIPEVKEK